MSLVELPENNSRSWSESWVVWYIRPHWAAFALIQLLPTASKLPILLSHAFLLDLIRCGLSPLTMCLVQAGHNLLISPKSAFPRLWIKPFSYITCLLSAGCSYLICWGVGPFLKKQTKKPNPSPHWGRIWLFFFPDSTILCIDAVCRITSWSGLLLSELIIM